MTIIETYANLLDEVESLMKQGYGRYLIAEKLDIKPHQARKLITHVLSEQEKDSDEDDMKPDFNKIMKQKQKLMDDNRIERKKSREAYRQINALEEFVEKFCSLLSRENLSKYTNCHSECEKPKAAIIHISDAHFNELIEEENNKYDFEIASMRLKLLADRAKSYLLPMGVTEVVIAMTGDMMNSDRRLDEILNASTNRTQATFLAVDILQQFILDINQDFNVHVAYVTGNESRVGQEVLHSSRGATDNYDTMIFFMLKKLFEGSTGVNFIVGKDQGELPISIGGLNFLLLHGHGALKGNNIEKAVEQIKGRYASGHGIIIDYVIFGHLHSAIIGDYFARCSSLCGSNAYNEKDLNLSGRASQNIYIVHEGGLRDGIKVDLQIVSGDSYDIKKELMAFNTKSSSKLKKTNTIVQVVV